MTTSVQNRAPHLFAVGAAATCLIAAALALYLTELSRASALAIAPFALCLLGAAWYAHSRAHWPSTPWLITFGALATTTIVYGLALYIYGLLHPATAG